MKTVINGETHKLICHCSCTSFTLAFLGSQPHAPNQMMATCSQCGDHVLIDFEGEPDRYTGRYDNEW